MTRGLVDRFGLTYVELKRDMVLLTWEISVEGLGLLIIRARRASYLMQCESSEPQLGVLTWESDNFRPGCMAWLGVGERGDETMPVSKIGQGLDFQSSSISNPVPAVHHDDRAM
jgi:hypothetical protein